MKLNFELVSEADSKGTKEYAVIIRGQFPITKYKHACELQDFLISLVDAAAKKARPKKLKVLAR